MMHSDDAFYKAWNATRHRPVPKYSWEDVTMLFGLAIVFGFVIGMTVVMYMTLHTQ